MGYWIGSDLVVNALTHYVTRSSSLPGPERKRLWDFLMDVDQHPRNALILSVPLGFTLAAQTGLALARQRRARDALDRIRGLVRLHVGRLTGSARPLRARRLRNGTGGSATC